MNRSALVLVVLVLALVAGCTPPSNLAGSSPCNVTAGRGQGVLFCEVYGLYTLAKDGDDYVFKIGQPMKAIRAKTATTPATLVDIDDASAGNKASGIIWTQNLSGPFMGDVFRLNSAGLNVNDAWTPSFQKQDGPVWAILLGMVNNLATASVDGAVVHEVETIDDKQGGLKLERMF